MPNQVTRWRAARRGVFEACLLCRELQKQFATVGRLTKGDKSPVTVADFAAQAVIAHRLRETLGTVTLVAEESASELRSALSLGRTEIPQAVLAAVRMVWGDASLDDVLDAIDLGAGDPPTDSLHGFWTLDPIDGTKGFLRGEQYSICLAWIEHGSPVLSIVGCPNLSKDFNRPMDDPDPDGTIYSAGLGEGLFETSASDPDEGPLAVRRLEPEEGEPLRLCESFDANGRDEVEMVMERVGELAEPLRLDGQAKYAVVARGQADAYLRLPRKNGYIERIWDHAPGALLAKESGCPVTDVGGKTLDFSRGRGLEGNRGVIVASPRLHGRILAAIESTGLADPR